MLREEHKNLRKELQFLKNCQVQYFVLSVAAAGAIAGSGSKAEAPPLIYLAPLLVILPCWWIIFDKGTTIARIVGYLTILEGLILAGNRDGYGHIGWENALSRFRDKEKKVPWLSKIGKYVRGIGQGAISAPFLTTHKYWSINWWTFFGLGIASLRMGFTRPFSIISPWGLALVLFVISSIHNLSVLGRLTRGGYSYMGSHKMWKEVLCSLNAQAYFDEMFKTPTKTDARP